MIGFWNYSHQETTKVTFVKLTFVLVTFVIPDLKEMAQSV